jgi:predicted nucleic acid-binding protein
MDLVVDTNVLYTFFWKGSAVRKFLMRMDLGLFSPEFALEEINSHKSDILKKTKLSEEEFKEIKRDLAVAVSFIPIEEYRELLKHFEKSCPDSQDIDFLALASKLKLPLWSNDGALKRQKEVDVLSTSDLLKMPEFFKAIFPERE